ncbi:hypothetical protein ACETAC_05825 [Aceticella autotrophica]|uniref:Uncharacterized protein n=1 Tax=Aceticella autotrophica TaxID=2755338 RepID=A0A974Y2T6_9THEO|nr:hypothetical protein [Aceticella autotrophica]QSZ26450.1 hypothetical protein ACETAC_05825 [Aceticella autotrophica]
MKKFTITFVYYGLMIVSAFITLVLWLNNAHIHSSYLILLLGSFILYKWTGRRITILAGIYSVYIQILALIYLKLFGILDLNDLNDLKSSLLILVPLILITIVFLIKGKGNLKNLWKIITGRY